MGHVDKGHRAYNRKEQTGPSSLSYYVIVHLLSYLCGEERYIGALSDFISVYRDRVLEISVLG